MNVDNIFSVTQTIVFTQPGSTLTEAECLKRSQIRIIK
jgi:hypothetical protein